MYIGTQTEGFKVKRIKLFLTAVAAIMVLAGCSQKNISYMQDTVAGRSYPVSRQPNIVARPGDRIQILVNCSDPQTAALFALITPQRTVTASNTTDNANNPLFSSYQIDDKGDINFPLLGNVYVGGLTAPQIARLIEDQLVKRELVKDPIVIADFTNLHYSVLGEVNNPGSFSIDNNRVTIMEALAAAGDLTIYGKRENVKVVREQDGERVTYLVDLRDSRLFDSPAYYLQQNDVVYVEPNQARTGQSSVNENQWKTPGLWISIASFLTTIGVLIFK